MLRFPSFRQWNQGGHAFCVPLLLLVLITGCKVGPDYCGPPASTAPIEWTQQEKEKERVEPQLPALDDWWTVFDDPILTSILADINEQNLTLRAAAWKIYQARASLCATRGDLFPRVGMNAAYSLNKISGERPGMAGANLISQSWAWGLSANWEIDVFGQLRRMVEAQEAEVEATEDDYRNVKIVLLADAARTYIDARLCQERMEIIRANIKQQKQFLTIIEARYKAGKDNRQSYAQAMGNLNLIESQYPSVVSEYQACLNRLSVLIGSPPGTVDELMRKVEAIPVAPDAVAVSVPADILHRRPDIRAMERRIAAQTARIGVAEAEKYPKFFILGSFGLEAAQLKNIFGPRSITASVTPSMQWSIFQFGKIRCYVMVQEGITEQMRYQYQQTVLDAAAEVDNGISSFVNLQQRVKSLEETVLHNREYLQIAERLYAGGRQSFLPVLDAQRTVLQSEETLAVARAGLASSVVQIYRALGGGWQVDPVASSTTRQVNRFVNRSADGVGVASSSGDGVNLNGSVRQRNLPDSVARPSQRDSVSTLNTMDSPMVAGSIQGSESAAPSRPAPSTKTAAPILVEENVVGTKKPVPPNTVLPPARESADGFLAPLTREELSGMDYGDDEEDDMRDVIYEYEYDDETDEPDARNPRYDYSRTSASPYRPMSLQMKTPDRTVKMNLKNEN